MEERKLNEKESLELIAQMIQNSKKNLQVGARKPIHPLGMVGSYYLINCNGHADAHQQPDVELALVRYPRHRMANHDVATEKGRETGSYLHGQGTESRMDVHRRHRDDRLVPPRHLCQEHDADATRSLHPDGHRRIHNRSDTERPGPADKNLQRIAPHYDGIVPHCVHEGRLLLVLHHILPRIHCNAGYARLSLKQGGKETCSKNLTRYYTASSDLV